MFEFDFRAFEEMHDKDNGKYKEGEIVRYIGPKYRLDDRDWRKEYMGKEFEVRAVNVQDEESTEYLLAGVPYLVWEHEIESITECYDLPEILASILLSDDDDIRSLTIDDFYDFVKIPMEFRTDLGTQALKEQANTLYKNAR